MSKLPTFDYKSIAQGYYEQNLAQEMLLAWKDVGAFQLLLSSHQSQKLSTMAELSRNFFQLPAQIKSQYRNDITYSGYIALEEEITDNKTDFCEVFTICQDISPDDHRVQSQWPCHGPVPWPNDSYQQASKDCFIELKKIGDALLKILTSGLELRKKNLLDLIKDGWHHMRLVHYPATNKPRGIGSHTDYGFIVMVFQKKSGLYIRPPVEGERRARNWLEGESSAGQYENVPPWIKVDAQPSTLSIFPGDIFQFLTNNKILATPHKILLDGQERSAIAYFHEPNFNATLVPIEGGKTLHYGKHFTNMFLRSYPKRATTKKIYGENRLENFLEKQQRC